MLKQYMYNKRRDKTIQFFILKLLGHSSAIIFAFNANHVYKKFVIAQKSYLKHTKHFQ